MEGLWKEPVPNTSCGSYFAPYIETLGVYLTDPEALSHCEFCPLPDTNTFMSLLKSSYDTRWRDFGILWVYVIVKIILALFFYWLTRVPKERRVSTARSLGNKKGSTSTAGNTKDCIVKQRERSLGNKAMWGRCSMDGILRGVNSVELKQFRFPACRMTRRWQIGNMQRGSWGKVLTYTHLGF